MNLPFRILAVSALLLLVAVVYTPFLRKLFHFSEIDFLEFGISVFLGILSILATYLIPNKNN